MAPPRRKRRPGQRIGSPADDAAPGGREVSGSVDPVAATASEKPSRSEQRNASARATLMPLAPRERPTALIVASAAALVVGVAVVIGALTVHDLARRGGSLVGAAFLAAVLVSLSAGMWRRRYWAVLAFQALLTFQVLVTALALLVAATVYAAVICVLSISLSGWLFWKLIRVMGRLQATDMAGRPQAAQIAAPANGGGDAKHIQPH